MAQQPPPLQAQWALNETTNGVLAVSRGLIQAATSDNVSPLSLMTCESFGSLLPATPETRLKVEQLARRNHTSHVLNFISAQIGYLKGDSVELLSRSDGGIRFLCLMATFCTMPHYEAGIRVDSLLEATQQRGQLRPTISQLQGLMKVLESKLALADFAATVAGWETWYSCQLDHAEKDRFRLEGRGLVPSRHPLQKVILTLSETSRLGEEQSVIINTRPAYVPWLIAFIKWSIGSPPFVQLTNGRILNYQDAPLVVLVVHDQYQAIVGGEHVTNRGDARDIADLQISASYRKKSLRSLVVEADKNEPEYRWRGLMTARDWANYRFHGLSKRFPELKSNTELLDACGQSIFFIVAILPDLLWFGEADTATSHERDVYKEARFLSFNLLSTAFPNAEERIALAQELLGAELPPGWHDNVAKEVHHEGNLKMMNAAFSLGPTFQSYGLGWSNFESSESRANDFLKDVIMLGANLAVLSLFGASMELLPMMSPGTIDPSDTFTAFIVDHWEAFWTEGHKPFSCLPNSIFEHAAKLLGHEAVGKSTIMSSMCGQTLYPAIFDSRTLIGSGYLRLCALPGLLNMNGMRFCQLEESAISRSYSSPTLATSPMIVGQGEQLRADFTSTHAVDDLAKFLHWNISVLDDRLLGGLVLGNSRESAWKLIANLQAILLTPSCQHAPGTQAGEVAHHFTLETCYMPPGVRQAGQGFGKRLLIAAGRSYVRLLEMICAYRDCHEMYVVVHVDGCIRCALQLCLDHDLRIVIS